MNSMAPARLPRPILDRTPPSAPAGRTLAVFHLAEPSGPSLSLCAELAWLADAAPVEVVVPGAGRVASDYAGFAEVTTLDYAPLTLATASRVARDVRTFRAHIRRTRPGRVIAVTTALPAVLLAARAEGVPALLYAGEVVPTAPGLARRLGGRLVLRLARTRADVLLCCSRTVAGQFDGADAPVLVAYPPVAPAPPGDGAAFRARHDIGVESPLVATVGNIGRARGQDLLIRALPRLLEGFPGLRVAIAGAPHPRQADVRYESELHALAERLGVGDAIAWPGHVERVADLYAAADVVVNPSRRESFGRVAAEALLAGTPVVATRVEAVPEVLRDGIDAVLVPPEDPAALADATAGLLDSPELATRLVRAGAERVRTEFSPARSLEQFARAVAELPAPEIT